MPDNRKRDDMRGKLSTQGVNASQRKVMDYLRSGGWTAVSKLPFSVGSLTMERLVQNGWIERQGEGRNCEIKLTPQGLEALQTRV